MKLFETGNSHDFANAIDDAVRNNDVKSISVKYYDYHNTRFISHIDVIINDEKYVLDYEFELDKITEMLIQRCNKYVSDLEMLKKAIKHYAIDIFNL